MLRADRTTPRTTALEVHLMNPAEASQRESVHLTGVVTGILGWKNAFFLQDATSGIFILRRSTLPEVHAGDRVVVDGVTDPGRFAPGVAQGEVRVVGHGALPPAPHRTAANLAWGVQDSQWAAIQGEVRSVESKNILGVDTRFLTVNIGAPDLITVSLHKDTPGYDWQSLVGATVTIRGVCGTVFNDRRQFAGLRLFVEGQNDIRVDRPAPADPFDFPFRNISGLMQFGIATSGMGQLKIQGVVTANIDQKGFYLQDGTGGTFISDKLDRVEVGSELQVVGYPAMVDATPMLQATHLRKIGDAQVRPVLLKRTHDLFEIQDDLPAVRSDSILVEVSGRLLEYVPGRSGGTLLVDTPAGMFRALLPESGKHDTWLPGSMLRLRGVCVVGGGEDFSAKSVELQLRSAEDVMLLQKAPWWSAEHALGLSIVLGAFLLVMLVWVAFLRRQARLQALVATDPLTGLYNRRGFLLLANKQIEVLQRRGHAFLLFYFDVNRFKQINDTHGHRAGDAALRDVASLLRQVFRDADVLCRLGGDEFAVLATDVSQDAEGMLKTRLYEVLETMNRQTGRLFRISLSVGAIFCDRDYVDHSIEDLLEQADERMYTHKRRKHAAEAILLEA